VFISDKSFLRSAKIRAHPR